MSTCWHFLGLLDLQAQLQGVPTTFLSNDLFCVALKWDVFVLRLVCVAVQSVYHRVGIWEFSVVPNPLPQNGCHCSQDCLWNWVYHSWCSDIRITCYSDDVINLRMVCLPWYWRQQMNRTDHENVSFMWITWAVLRKYILDFCTYVSVFSMLNTAQRAPVQFPLYVTWGPTNYCNEVYVKYIRTRFRRWVSSEIALAMEGRVYNGVCES